MEALIAEIQVHEDKKENGQWLKSIKFKLPIVKESFDLSLDNQNHVEVATLLERVSNRKADSYVKLNVKMEDYYRIKDAEGGEADG